MRADVYRNLRADNPSERWSIKCMESGDNYGIVADHVRSALMTDVRTVVQMSGVKRFHQTGYRNVHAFLRGTIVKKNFTPSSPSGTILYYDDEGQFRNKSNDQIIETIDRVYLNEHAWIIEPSPSTDRKKRA